METTDVATTVAKPVKIRASLPLPNDGYQRLPYVNYWRIEKGCRPRRVNKQCFGSMQDFGVPSAIRYIAPITTHMANNMPVAEGAVDFYLDFMVRILRRPSSPKFKIKRTKEDVFYRIDTKGLHFKRVLFYLTWFRYVHHYPEMIHALFTRAEPGDTDDKLFEKFQQAHFEMSSGKLKVISKTYADESLIYKYWPTDYKIVPLANLISNIDSAANPHNQDLKVQSYIA